MESREVLKRLIDACQARTKEYQGRSDETEIPSVENALYCLCKELAELQISLLTKSY